MGFLNKIFNSSNQSSSADNSDNLITFYKAKYQKMEQKGCDDIVNIGLHFILKNVRPYAAPCSEA